MKTPRAQKPVERIAIVMKGVQDADALFYELCSLFVSLGLTYVASGSRFSAC